MMYSFKKQKGPASPERSGGGYTLIELMVAVGLFALIMTLASGAYIMMIGLSHKAQGIATGIDNLSFALETMTRSIRTGHSYSCGSILGIGDCISGENSNFTFTDIENNTVTYSLSSSAIQIRENLGPLSSLTDSSTVTIDSLRFYVFGTHPASASSGADSVQARVTMIISGTVPGKVPQSFTIETGATMRGSDI